VESVLEKKRKAAVGRIRLCVYVLSKQRANNKTTSLADRCEMTSSLEVVLGDDDENAWQSLSKVPSLDFLDQLITYDAFVDADLHKGRLRRFIVPTLTRSVPARHGTGSLGHRVNGSFGSSFTSGSPGHHFDPV